MNHSFKRNMSRRTLLRGVAGGALATMAASLLAACGEAEDGDDDPISAGVAGGAAPTTRPLFTGSSTSNTPAPVAPTEEAPTEVPGVPEPTREAVTGTLAIYSGRDEELVGALIDQFAEQAGIEVKVEYGSSSELSARLIQEGAGSPADVFLSEDAGALGGVERQGLFQSLPAGIVNQIESRFRSGSGNWVGVTGRARTVVYNTALVDQSKFPQSILGFTDPAWKGRIGWAPTNGSFQAFVTALRKIEGEIAAREWLEGIQANEPVVFPKNSAIVAGVIAGEAEVGFVNHYYLLRAMNDAANDVDAANYWYGQVLQLAAGEFGDPGALINVSGAGVLATAANPAAGEAFVSFLISPDTQKHFASETFEFPLLEGVAADPRLLPLRQIQTPNIELADLADTAATTELLRNLSLID